MTKPTDDAAARPSREAREKKQHTADRRTERLAEQLRVNLKRRKAAARRSSEPDAE